MEIQLETGPASQVDADLLIIGVHQGEDIEAALRKLDAEMPASFVTACAEECERESFTGKIGQSMQLPTYGAIACHRLLLRGMGKKAEAGPGTVRKALGSIAKKLAGQPKLSTIALALPDAGESSLEPEVQAAVEGWLLGAYSFNKYKTEKDDKKTEKGQLACMLIMVGAGSEAEAGGNADLQAAANRGRIIAESANFARDLIAEPPAYMTPSRLAEAAQGLADGKTITCQVLDRAEAEKQGMGAFLGVARGAKEPPKFIILKYSHPDARKTIAIAGKGITFDSGGLSIKTAQGMETMKYDMSGAAVAIAAVHALRQLKPKLNVIVAAAATENMPGSGALHPGDILTAMSGKTIEVNNTDAEGRLVLADALSYLCKENPEEIIDLATLTGAVVTALGRAAAGIMGNNDALIKRIIASGADAGEKFWQLPMYDEYKDALKSEIADLKNAGARGEAPSSAAAMFLKEFVDNRPWAHLDIAGPAWIDKDKDELNKGGTAFGLRTLCYYLLSQAESQ